MLVCALAASLGCAELIGLTEDYHWVEGGDGGGAPPQGGASSSGGATVGSGGAPDDGSAANIRIPDGKLVYHRFSNYWAGDSEMFVVEFPSASVSPELGERYGICNPMNASFSPDGRFLAVSGALRGEEPCGPTDQNSLEIFLLDLTDYGGEKTRVTQNEQSPDEDPQFSFDGRFLLFKHADHIVEWTVGSEPFGGCAEPPPGSYCYDRAGGKQSKPVVTPEDGTICYFEGDSAGSDIFCFDRARGRAGEPLADLRWPVAARPNVFEARPLVFGAHLYFQRWRSSTNQATFLARKPLAALDGLEEYCRFCTDEGSAYRDPCPLGDERFLFSGNLAGRGGADLFVTRWDGESIESLDHWVPGLNSPRNDLGASFWPAARAP